MSLGRILLLAVSVLVLFGVGQRVLDKMRLTDRQALFFMALILVGGWIPSIPLSGSVRVNIGGALVPLGLCIYLFVRAGTARERWRAGIASALSAAAVLGLGMLLPDEPEAMPFDINYAYGLLAGAIAYVLGRSRISSFIAGGAGALDAVVLSGLTAVLLSELLGALLERITGAVHAHAEIRGGQQVLVRTDRERGKDE